jgi:hypothetical protein
MEGSKKFAFGRQIFSGQERMFSETENYVHGRKVYFCAVINVCGSRINVCGTTINVHL